MAMPAKVLLDKQPKKKKVEKVLFGIDFFEVVNQDETSTGYVICKSCEAIYVQDSHKMGTSIML